MKKSSLKIYLLVLLVLITSIWLIYFAISKIKQSHIEEINHEMEIDEKKILNAMKHKMSSNINALKQTEFLFQSSSRVEREEFHRYARGVLEMYPEIHALEWLPVIFQEEKEEYESSVREEGFEDFFIKEYDPNKGMVPINQRKFYTPVHFIEPYLGNEFVLGLDISAYTKERGKILKTMAPGKLSLSRPMSLVQDIGKQRAVAVYLPHYSFEGGSNTDKNKIVGFVLFILKMDDFFKQVLEDFPSGTLVNYRLMDVTNSNEYITGSKEEFLESDGWSIISLPWKISERNWLLEINYDVNQNLEYQTAKFWSWVFAIIAALITLLISYLYYSRLKFKQQQSDDALAFQNEEDRYKKLLNSTADGYFLQDLSGNLLDVNKISCEVMGYTREELLELTVFDINETIEDTSREEYINYFKKFPRGKTVVRELNYKKKDGTIFPVEISLNKFVYNDTDVLSGFIRDISERKEYENSLKLATETAEKANLAKSEFLAKMSHEFRTPMHSILSFSDMGLKRIKNAPLEKLGGYFSNIQVSGQRLMKLLNSLLDLAKLETGMLKFCFEKCSIFNILDDCIIEQQLQLNEKNLGLSISKGDISGDVICDIDKIRQVITNLLANAIKFTDESSALSVQIDEETQLLSVPAIKFSISDHGQGIPEGELEAVFDKFTQSSLQSSLYEGTGLGLAICSEIIEGHSGNIWAENIEGGACLSFVIPLSPSKNLNRRSTDKSD